ncbi:MAG: peptide synthase [Opitutus sp.]|nr:peptide synthase [Opitutus sp.]
MTPLGSPPAANAPGANIARHLGHIAAVQPHAVALKVPRGRTRAGEIDYLSLSFRELDREVGAWCDRLTRAGVRPGDRTLVMVSQGLPLIASVFAIFKLGAVPIVIDPGMGLKSFLVCVARSRPRALVGIPLAQIVSRVCRAAFRSVAVRVSARRALTARLTAGKSSDELPTAPSAFPSAPTDLAAILFTSGSTGAPKGVCYEHGMFDAQVRLIRDTYSIAPGEIDLPMLPIFALFNPALGMTTIVPEIDPRRPAAFNPAHIVQAIQQENVTNSFGSPTLWRKIGDHCRTHNLTLPSLRRVLCAGAAVPADLWQNSRRFLPHGRLHSPYGATEALPVATISSDEIHSLTTAPADPECHVIRGTSLLARGACVGRPLPGIVVKIIAISDERIASLADVRELPPGEIGEIIVHGPVVTKIYDALPEATALAKISDSQLSTLSAQPGGGSAAVWHRTGDCGYFDADKRLWFCGRKTERVVTNFRTLHTEPCEQVFRGHPRATRCALIGIGELGRQRAAIVAEATVQDSDEARALARELRTLALQHPHTEGIKAFYFHERFPVDVRHNAKIHRRTLAKWARTAKGFESDPKR